jgi:hypothetical protein
LTVVIHVGGGADIGAQILRSPGDAEQPALVGVCVEAECERRMRDLGGDRNDADRSGGDTLAGSKCVEIVA